MITLSWDLGLCADLWLGSRCSLTDLGARYLWESSGTDESKSDVQDESESVAGTQRILFGQQLPPLQDQR